jgi:hypothetical protein
MRVSTSPKPEDAFLGSTGPRAGRLGRILGESLVLHSDDMPPAARTLDPGFGGDARVGNLERHDLSTTGKRDRRLPA